MTLNTASKKIPSAVTVYLFALLITLYPTTFLSGGTMSGDGITLHTVIGASIGGNMEVNGTKIGVGMCYAIPNYYFNWTLFTPAMSGARSE